MWADIAAVGSAHTGSQKKAVPMSHARLRALVVAAVLAGTIGAASPAGAGVPGGNQLISEPTFNRDEPEFTFAPEGDPSCTGETVSLTGPDGELDPEGLVTFATPLSGTFAPGDAPAGYYTLTIECQNGEFPETWVAEFAFARLTIEKVVEGEAPAGTTFTIEADCFADGQEGYDFTEVREFPAAGGTQDVILYGGALCTTTETDDGGATSSEVTDPETDFVPAPVDLTTTVTNTFEAEEPEPTPEPPPAALPVALAPTFTG